jgi:hypothetical protein
VIDLPDRPQLPLTNTRKALLALGATMFVAHVIVALLIAPEITGEGDAKAGAILALWAASIPWCATVALLIVRQADLPDVATASMLATIAPFALFTLSAALDARGTKAEYDLVSATFLGVTAGALTAMIVWGIAMGVARLLKLPTTSSISC